MIMQDIKAGTTLAVLLGLLDAVHAGPNAKVSQPCIHDKGIPCTSSRMNKDQKYGLIPNAPLLAVKACQSAMTGRLKTIIF